MADIDANAGIAPLVFAPVLRGQCSDSLSCLLVIATRKLSPQTDHGDNERQDQEEQERTIQLGEPLRQRSKSKASPI